MPDVLTPAQRHRCMSHIRSKATKPEILVRKWLWAHGYRYRLNVKSVPDKPDIVMRRYRTAIFVNGCFWHGHEGCSLFVMPKSRELSPHPTSYTEQSQNTTTRLGCCVPVGMIYTPAGRRTSLVEVRY